MEITTPYKAIDSPSATKIIALPNAFGSSLTAPIAAGAPAAIGATAEDPKSFGKSIIFVALGEGFGLYGLLVAIMILIL